MCRTFSGGRGSEAVGRRQHRGARRRGRGGPNGRNLQSPDRRRLTDGARNAAQASTRNGRNGGRQRLGGLTGGFGAFTRPLRQVVRQAKVVLELGDHEPSGRDPFAERVHGHAGIKFGRPGHTLHKVAKHSAHDEPATVRGPGVPGQTERLAKVGEPRRFIGEDSAKPKQRFRNVGECLRICGPADSLSDRCGLAGQPGRVDGLRRRIEWRQLRRRRRRASIAVHRGRILGPHLGVLRLGGRDRRRVLAKEVRRQQRHQQRPVGRDLRGRHGREKRRLISTRRCHRLAAGLLGLPGGAPQPRHLGRGGSHHGRRGGPLPWPVGQASDQSVVGGRRGLQLGGQRLPGRRGSQHRSRTGSGVHQRGVDLRR
ncbi:Uncharacterised protein [Mycobacterium tuberculosis]|nr:Uncharacterised protein [Mycobacterium tuberculosis]